MTEDDDDPILDVDELALSLLATEEWLEERGWDLNPLVLALQVGDPENPDGPDDDWDDEDDLVYAVVGEGDPHAILSGLDASDQVALVVAVEQWAWPQELPESERVGEPCDHRARIELRTVTALTCDGQVLSVLRPKGGEAIVRDGGDATLVEALQGALHPPD